VILEVRGVIDPTSRNITHHLAQAHAPTPVGRHFAGHPGGLTRHAGDRPGDPQAEVPVAVTGAFGCASRPAGAL
jgi:hypothetical protein